MNGGSSSSKNQNPFDYLRTRETEEKPTIESLNKESEDYLKRIQWDGPRVYDSYGLLKRPTDKELFRYRQLCMPKGENQETIEKLLKFRRKHKILTPFYDDTYWDSVQYEKNNKP